MNASAASAAVLEDISTVPPRTRDQRWRDIRATIARLERIVQTSARVDSLQASKGTGSAWEYLREADLVDRDLDTLSTTIAKLCDDVTCDLLRADLERKKKFGSKLKR